jgi:hypothetical protein
LSSANKSDGWATISRSIVCIPPALPTYRHTTGTIVANLLAKVTVTS